MRRRGVGVLTSSVSVPELRLHLAAQIVNDHQYLFKSFINTQKRREYYRHKYPNVSHVLEVMHHTT